MAEVQGRVIVVTGAGKPDGICAKTCMTFIEREPDCQIVVLDLLADRLDEWAADYDNVTFYKVDVSKKEEVVAAKDKVMEKFGRVDVLVCGSAWQDHGSLPLETLSEESWRGCIEVNLNGTFWCCQAFGSEMLDKGGAIVNIASMGGLNPIYLSGSYSPSKAGIVMLTQQLAGEWGPRKVRVNALAPGQTYTSINSYRIDGPEAQPGARERRNQMTPLRRIGEATDQANGIYFLASPEASYINGHTLVVDGGMTINTLACLMTAF